MASTDVLPPPSSPSSSRRRNAVMLHGLSEAQGWSMNKNMACSKERTMERHCFTLYAKMQPKFARWRAQIWPHQRYPHAGRRSLNTERAAIVQTATKSRGRRLRACVQGPSDGWSCSGASVYRIRLTLLRAHPCNPTSDHRRLGPTLALPRLPTLAPAIPIEGHRIAFDAISSSAFICTRSAHQFRHGATRMPRHARVSEPRTSPARLPPLWSPRQRAQSALCDPSD